MIDPILARVKLEFARGIVKHGDWSGYSDEEMIHAVCGEMAELLRARFEGDVTGPHGMIAEATQAAACLCKLVMQLERRQALLEEVSNV